MSAVDPKASETGVPAVAAAPAAEAAQPVAADPVPEAKEPAPPAAAPKDEQKDATTQDQKAELAQAPKEDQQVVQGDKPAPPLDPIEQLWDASKASSHPEIWGVTLADPETHVPTRIVLQKYLNANDGDVAKAKEQLIKTLEWRAKMKPLDLLKKAYNKAKFGNLGYVTTYTAGDDTTDPESKEVINWNVYGAVKSIDETFGNLEQFIEWRVAIMELALQELSLSTATKPITATYDPYKIIQVHDYKSISFLRQSPHVKAASTETIKIFAQNYPELLKEKFFVNVPAVMGFVYAFMKLFVAAKTIRKFHPMSNGANLAREFAGSRVKDLGERLPAEYGGKGADLKTQGKETLLEE